MLRFEGMLLNRNKKDQLPPFYQEERLQPVQAVLVKVWGEHNHSTLNSRGLNVFDKDASQWAYMM
jgi:hypothetical protein